MDQSEILKFENANKTLRLSEAIRRGARRGPQCKYLLRDGHAYCALGAAAIGRGWERDKHAGIALEFLSDVYKSPLWDEIVTRNDAGHTREAIANWLQEQGL